MSDPDSSNEANVVKVTDVLGLAKPIERLIELVCAGFGILWNPIQTGREAKADARAIRTLSDAAEDTLHIPLEIEYQGEKIQMQFGSKEAQAVSIESRASQRLLANQVRKQHNIETVVQLAAEELMSEESVPDQAIDDEEWATRFFRHAEDLSSEKLRQLWARILAGKIKQPGLFELRTLDFLKSISEREAKLFEGFRKFIIVPNKGSAFVLPSMINEHTIPLDELMELVDIGLIGDGGASFEGTLDPDGIAMFTNGNTLVSMITNEQRVFQIPMRPLTRIGCDLLKLSGQVGESDDQTVSALVGCLKKSGLKPAVQKLADAALEKVYRDHF